MTDLTAVGAAISSLINEMSASTGRVVQSALEMNLNSHITALLK
jgi:hypothetical protein